MTRDFDPQIVRVAPERFPTAGTYRGIAEVQEHVRTGRGAWAEGSCEPEKFLIKGEKVVVYLYAWVRLKGATDWTGGRFADGFAFRNGKTPSTTPSVNECKRSTGPASKTRNSVESHASNVRDSA